MSTQYGIDRYSLDNGIHEILVLCPVIRAGDQNLHII